MRITSKDVRAKLEEVNHSLANEPGSNLQLDLLVWSGDGKKYQLVVKGAGSNLTPALSGSEMYFALGAYLNIRDRRRQR